MTAERKPSEIADMLANLHPTRMTISDSLPAIGRFVLDHWNEVIAALRSAAPPRGEPVAWLYSWPSGSKMSVALSRIEHNRDDLTETPLYAAPSAGRDAEDARRYRWLRDLPWNAEVVDALHIRCPISRIVNPARLDAAIDAAITAERDGSRG